jgi:hypothetical protein
MTRVNRVVPLGRSGQFDLRRRSPRIVVPKARRTDQEIMDEFIERYKHSSGLRKPAAVNHAQPKNPRIYTSIVPVRAVEALP